MQRSGPFDLKSDKYVVRTHPLYGYVPYAVFDDGEFPVVQCITCSTIQDAERWIAHVALCDDVAHYTVSDGVLKKDGGNA